ncbi:MAG: class III cytochrome C family protein [Magnetococcales bacterium]|nr:class III cytochrome C family protein [Magnetococcales bacterium]
MNRPVYWILLANLAVVVVLVWFHPQLMLAPGGLIAGHRGLERDCLACHALGRGAASDKCVACHKVDSIGVLTSKGVALTNRKNKTPFHQKLSGQDCVACHGDHAGVAKFRSSQRFSHPLLDAATREGCSSCHKRPGDGLHRQVPEQCSQCHTVEGWKPARFNHDQLTALQREGCGSCHQSKAPTDGVHRQAGGQCGRCHTLARWKPATFDHRKFFAFDRNHETKCATCHPSDDYRNYTCYGCHEHTQGKIRKEHLEEGIRDFERCVLCHRNANEDDAKALWRSGRWREGVAGAPALSGSPLETPLPRSDRSKRHEGREDHGD